MSITYEKEFSDRLLALVDSGFGGKWSRLAKVAKISTGAFSRYTAAQNLPGLKQLKKICEVSGASAVWLIWGEGPMMQRDLPATAAKAAADDETLMGASRMVAALHDRMESLQKELADYRVRLPFAEDLALAQAWRLIPPDDQKKLRSAILAASAQAGRAGAQRGSA